jgi:L-aspartate oxidase
MIKTDVLIVGSGIAGLSYALKLAEYSKKNNVPLKITLITKNELKASNTSYAQGGIASVTKQIDNFEKHIEDTLNAGAYLNDKKVVNLVVKQAPDRINDLLNWGTRFDKINNNDFDLAKEGGHSEARILHYKDLTGAEIERALIERLKSYSMVKILEYHFAVDLITEHHFGEKITRETPDKHCFGIYALNAKTGEIITINSKITLLATGGIGQVYETTTNPLIATGDGIAMAYRAKAIIKDMEFVQFHPTALYTNKKDNPAFLISEAVRGFGGILRNSKGEDFMYKYDKRGSLAPRDIVARAIDNEMKKSGDKHVWLDVTHTDINSFKAHFPTIYNKCSENGIDVSKNYIPVRPAAHYLCGGILVDIDAQTTIKNLFASGESACTGLHGANRLASNSLLEALVFSHQAYLKTIELLPNINLKPHLPDWNIEGTKDAEENILIEETKNEIQSIMSNYVGIVRSNERLKRAADRLKLIYEESESLYRRSKISQSLIELRNMRSIAYLIIKQAQQRKENIGLHYNKDLVKE